VGRETLIFRGKLYGEDGVSLIDKDKNNSIRHDEVVEYLKNMYSIMMYGNREEYINLWDKDSRGAAVGEYYNQSPEAWKSFSRRAKGDEDHRLLSMVRYGDYVIALILVIQTKDSIFAKAEGLLERNGKLWLTNNLEEDVVFDYFNQTRALEYVEEFKKRRGLKR